MIDWVMVVVIFGPSIAIGAIWSYVVFVLPWRRR
jgi:hypothetical protein